MRHKSYSYDDYRHAMKLFKKGLGLTEISRELGISYSTVRNWAKYDVKPTNRKSKRKYTYDEYIDALKLYREGYTPLEISIKLKITYSAVEAWIYRGKKPLLAKWITKLSNELAYIIGVLYGDGYTYKINNRYKIGLKVKDIEFAETFSKYVARILDRKIKKPFYIKRRNIWEVCYGSKAFYMWYKDQKLDTLKPYVEYDKDTVAYFLRGVYDSEGYNYRCRRIHLYNNSLKLLQYSQYLLERYFNIIARGPYLNKSAGTVSTKRDGEKIKANHDVYSIAISRKRHVQKFLNEIGFSITEKQLGLQRRNK